MNQVEILKTITAPPQESESDGSQMAEGHRSISESTISSKIEKERNIFENGKESGFPFSGEIVDEGDEDNERNEQETRTKEAENVPKRENHETTETNPKKKSSCCYLI